MRNFLRTIMYQRRRKCQRTCLQVLMVLFSAIFLLLMIRLYYEVVGYMPIKPVEQKNRNFDKYITKYDHNYWKNTTVKKILIWTPFFGGWGWLDDAKNEMPSCPSKCTVTGDKTEVESSDLVLFHSSDLWKNSGLLGTIFNPVNEMPKTRTPNQVWAIMSMEPMQYMWGQMKPNTFNWTVQHRRESTVYFPFANYYKMSDKEIKDKTNKKEEKVNYFKGKDKFATTLVSNCKDQAKRYRIIRELQKYIELDYFGYCAGKSPCPAGVPTFTCGEKYLKGYKFYLAFENSFCRDYVSEKYWNALHRRQIPIIAAPDYNLELLPKHSYLNVFDFPSIKALTDKMKEISENEDLYNSYFDSIQYYNEDPTSVYCKICKELHANRPAQSYNDIEGWLKDDMCTKSSTWSLVSGFFDRLLFDLGLS